MKYTGRIVTILVPPAVLILWCIAYYLLNKDSAYEFLRHGDHILLDISFSLLLIPLFWFLGKQYDRAKFLAEKDTLTQIYNRRFVLEIIPKLLALVDKKHHKLNVFVLDIDDFKIINDTYGHEVGDKVIQAVSNSLLLNTRKTDIIARWGGDEFIIIAPFSDQLCTQDIAERIEKGLDDTSKNLGIKISVSLGMSTFPDQAFDLDGLLKIADKNMYQVKLTKRSRNILYPLLD